MILKAIKSDSVKVAALHKETINEGFLSKLGVGFLSTLYSFRIKKELVLVYKEDNKVLGFVSCALSSQGIMKRFLFSSPGGILKLMLVILQNPKLIKSLLETWRAPLLSASDTNSNKEIPETERLSISVSPLAQKGGIGTQLLQALEDELKKKGVFNYKVIAGEKLEGANKFYLKNGFVLTKQINIHGNDVSNVYVKEICR